MNETEKKKKKNPLAPVTVILSVCVLVVLFLCVGLLLLVFKNREGFSFGKEKESEVIVTSEEPEKITYTMEEVDEMTALARAEGAALKESEIKEYIRAESEKKSPNLSTILRNLFTENLVYPGDGRYYFVDVSDAFPANPYVRENFVTEDSGYRFYREGEADKSIMCIDVSAHQGSIDWQAVAQSGVSAALIRAGYRGYGSGKMVEDEYVKGNLEGCSANGVKAGVYFFSQAINEAEVDEEVNTMLELVAPYGISGPIAIDVEKLDAESARGNTLTQEERTRLVKRFCEKVKEAGYEPMIYGNAYSLFTMLNYGELAEYPVWYAYYSDNLYFPYEVEVWQYSNTGHVPGINGNVDLNVMFEAPPNIDAPEGNE